MNYNKCIFAGNLTRDPETRTTGSGMTVTNFSLAINNRRGRDQEDTLFIKVVTFGKTAEIASQYLAKGANCLVEGRLQMDEYETRDGQKRRDPEVVADRLVLGSRAGSGGGGSGGGGGGSYGGDNYGGGGGSSSRAYDAQPSRQEQEERRRDYDEMGGGAPEGGTSDDLPF